MPDWQSISAGLFGAVLGWNLYFINRYRKDVVLGDLASVVSALGGAAVLALFPAGTQLFTAYGVGLAIGFFGYFLVLIGLVRSSQNFDADWFIDGRYKDAQNVVTVPGPTDRQRGMGHDATGPGGPIR